LPLFAIRRKALQPVNPCAAIIPDPALHEKSTAGAEAAHGLRLLVVRATPAIYFNKITLKQGDVMVDKELLDILCCPETKQDVTLVEGDIIKKINAKIKEGTLKNRGGEVVKEAIDAGLLREDKKFLYPIREDIPIMLIDEAIPAEQFGA
jgi:uncharacterized protein YbaR (Trm112 family)